MLHALTTRVNRRLICAFVLTALVSACQTAPTEASADEAIRRPAKTLMCVRATADSTAVTPPDANGGCPLGFDMKVWY